MFFVHFVVLENIGKRNNLHYPIKRWSGDQNLRKNNGMLRPMSVWKSRFVNANRKLTSPISCGIILKESITAGGRKKPQLS